jgi:GNAT superfamily N-acetyltransferase
MSRAPSPPEIRVLTAEALPAAAAVSAASLGIDISGAAGRALWTDRIAHLCGTDPAGGFVAERDGEVIGVAQAMRRERLWCLSLFGVDPGAQSGGAGRALLARALEYGAGTDAGMIVSSNDPRALRLYGLSGFSLHPTLAADGTVDRRALPAPDPGVRELEAGHLDRLEPLAREIRGAPYTTELAYAVRRGATVFACGARGFSVAQPGRGVWLLVARDEPAATALLWAALELAGDGERPLVRWLTGGQDWAVKTCLRAGLRIGAYGALCVRGAPGPLRPFIPSSPFA